MTSRAEHPLKPVFTLEHKSSVFSVKYNSDGKYCMTAGADRIVRLFNTQTSSLVHSFSGTHNKDIFDIAITEDNKNFVTCGGDRNFWMWDVSKAQTCRKFWGHMQKINCLEIHSNQSVLFSGSDDNFMKVWDLM